MRTKHPHNRVSAAASGMDRLLLGAKRMLQQGGDRMNALHARLSVTYAITLKNPWAHLIAHYGKDVENRTWMPHCGVDWLLIHAGKGWDDSAPEFAGDMGDPHTSAIVAIADLAFACDASLDADTVVCGCGEWAQPRQCHWKLANVRALPQPVSAIGKQGLWRPSSDVLTAVETALART